MLAVLLASGFSCCGLIIRGVQALGWLPLPCDQQEEEGAHQPQSNRAATTLNDPSSNSSNSSSINSNRNRNSYRNSKNSSHSNQINSHSNNSNSTLLPTCARGKSSAPLRTWPVAVFAAGRLAKVATSACHDSCRMPQEFLDANPDAKLISLGIGDTTHPLPAPIAEAMAAYCKGLGTLEGCVCVARRVCVSG
jgi:hypothetical protein